MRGIFAENFEIVNLWYFNQVLFDKFLMEFLPLLSKCSGFLRNLKTKKMLKNGCQEHFVGFL